MTDFPANNESAKNNKSLLSRTLTMGVVQLNSRDNVALADFYTEVIGLEIIANNLQTITLGNNNHSVLNLVSTPKLPKFTSKAAGLYHFAILFSSREQLASTLQKALNTAPESFVGSADHLVSEAFYFTDPEGNGIELYFDRPRDQWQWEDGQVVMGSTYIDPLQYIDQFAHTAKPESIVMGHVHLQVGDIPQAIHFYQTILGMYVTAQFPGAAFLSDGKYHHNLGVNTWNSNKAPARSQTTGLDYYEMLVEDRQDIAELQSRLEQNNILYHGDNNQLRTNDPWNNVVIIRSSK